MQYILIDSEISTVLLNSGIPINLHGFRYIKQAVFLVLQNEESLHHLTKSIYPMVAKKYFTTAGIVERGMRHAIDVSFRAQGLNGLCDMIEGNLYLGETRPSNGELIGLVSQIVKTSLYRRIQTDPNSVESKQLVKEMKDCMQNVALG